MKKSKMKNFFSNNKTFFISLLIVTILKLCFRDIGIGLVLIIVIVVDLVLGT